eukprot:gnl/MRDRNA2_/MRDRNA2_33720_c0_seq1.p1 gnl/MRDRNA2_/MRDRNA2_33720_c0~~gnl/MRDRNA2_/MRDRNA2_33720_c0_seq1.p1  ORF type:complete len:140 (+),score=36.82 gnl/MRDRNA2_/MRDRNA2_33720_c0_seq1:110-529(+)
MSDLKGFFESEEKPLKEAIFEKKSPSILHNWQKRTFRLYTKGLEYSDPKEWKPADKQRISIYEITDIKLEGLGLHIVLPNRTYELRAETEEIAEEWANAIRQLEWGSPDDVVEVPALANGKKDSKMSFGKSKASTATDS